MSVQEAPKERSRSSTSSAEKPRLTSSAGVSRTPSQTSADDGGFFAAARTAVKNRDGIHTAPGTDFSDEKVAAYWKNVYAESKYEGRHRFDPAFTWTEEEEKALVRKLDIRIMLFVWVMFIALDLIRRNINRVLPNNFLANVGMTQNDFNNGQIIYFASFLFMELPSGLISKKLGADVWIPIQIISWSTICSAQFAITSRTGFFVTRWLLGAAQGGFIPDMCLYLSYFYTAKELNARLSWFYTVLGMSQIIGSFLAVGFIELGGKNGHYGWQWLFALEGLISGIVGVLAFFLMPPSVTSTKGGVRGKAGWFTEREEYIAVNRVLRDDPTKGEMHNRQGVNAYGLWKAISEKDLWPIYLLGLVIYIPYQPPQTYLSATLKQLGFSTINSNLLAIPSQALFVVNCLWLPWLTRRFNEYSILSSVSNIWTLPLLIALASIPASLATHWSWVRFALLTLISAFPYCHPAIISWLSQNCHSVRNRAVSVCLYNMSYQVGSIVATQIYRTHDAPYYRKGTRGLIAISAWAIVQCWLTKLYYIYRNRQKEAEWKKLTPDERVEYTVTNKEQGTGRLDTRFVH